MEKFVKRLNGEPSGADFFRKCQEEQIPYIEINSSRIYSQIHWDYITLNSENEKIIKNNFTRYKSQIEHIFNHYKNEKSRIDLHDTEYRFFDIKNDVAEDLSRDIYDLILRMLKNQ